MEKTDKTFMRIDKSLLKELTKIKLAKRESYADAIKRMLEKEKKIIK